MGGERCFLLFVSMPNSSTKIALYSSYLLNHSLANVGDLIHHPVFPDILMSPALLLLHKVSNDTREFVDTILKPLLGEIMRDEEADAVKKYNSLSRQNDDEDEDDDEEEDEEENVPAKLQRLYMRLCVVNAVLENIDWVGPPIPLLSNSIIHTALKLILFWFIPSTADCHSPRANLRHFDFYKDISYGQLSASQPPKSTTQLLHAWDL